MFNRKSIYALNKKDPNAIVYTDADGNLIRLTCDDFASAAEFQRWKDWSDSDLRKEENADHKQSDNSISLEVLSEEATAIVSIEDEYMEQISADEAAVLVRLQQRAENRPSYNGHDPQEYQTAGIEEVRNRAAAAVRNRIREKLRPDQRGRVRAELLARGGARQTGSVRQLHAGASGVQPAVEDVPRGRRLLSRILHESRYDARQSDLRMNLLSNDI